MANTNGGVIIFGIEDDGSRSAHDCSELFGFDPAKITDQIHKYTGCQFSKFQLTEIVRQDGKYPAILIFPSELPLVFSKVGTYEIQKDKQKTAFSVGTVYFRHGAKSEPATQADIQQSFDRELKRVRDDWLGNIRKVVEAEPGAIVTVTTSANASNEVRLTRDPSAPAVRVQDLSDTHPHRQKEVMAAINKKMGLGKAFNSHDMKAVKWVENLEPSVRPDLVHRPHEKTSSQYSDEFIEFVCKKISQDPSYLRKCRDSYKHSLQRG